LLNIDNNNLRLYSDNLTIEHTITSPNSKTKRLYGQVFVNRIMNGNYYIDTKIFGDIQIYKKPT
jgi:hypothetical protein